MVEMIPLISVRTQTIVIMTIDDIFNSPPEPLDDAVGSLVPVMSSEASSGFQRTWSGYTTLNQLPGSATSVVVTTIWSVGLLTTTAKVGVDIRLLQAHQPRIFVWPGHSYFLAVPNRVRN